MAFNTWQFALFFSVVFILYYLPVFRRFQVVLIVAASLIFYFQGTGQIVLLLLGSILVNATISHRLFGTQSSQERRILLIAGICFNLLLLSLFKYDLLLLKGLRKLLHGFWTMPDEWISTAALVPLPLGISFYCFEGISLVVDSYKRLFQKENSIAASLRGTGLFISFFPHLISGPILRAGHFLPQIGPKEFSAIDWYGSFKWIVLGGFLKAFVGDNLGALCFSINFPHCLLNGSALNLALLIGYSARIFADFAGYSFIALGLAKLLGYEIPNNFNAPYISRSLGEFWKRWHISLSTWLRDYLFIPMGGSHCSRLRACFNVLVVMFLGGLWHGASLNFAFWGLFHGFGLIAEHAFFRRLKIPQSLLLELIQTGATFSFVTVAWLGFIFTNPRDIKRFLFLLFNDISVQPNRLFLFVIVYALPVLFLHLWHWAAEHGFIPGKSFWRSDLLRSLVLGLLIFLTVLNSGPQIAFIYFQF